MPSFCDCFLITTSRGHHCDKRLRLQSLTPVLFILPPKCIRHAPTFQLRRPQQDPHLSRGTFGCPPLLLLRSCCDFSRIRDSVVVWLCKHHNSCFTTHHCCQSHEFAHRINTAASSWRRLFSGTSLQVRASAHFRCPIMLHLSLRLNLYLLVIVSVLTCSIRGTVCNTTLESCLKRELVDIVDIKVAFSTPVCSNTSLESTYQHCNCCLSWHVHNVSVIQRDSFLSIFSYAMIASLTLLLQFSLMDTHLPPFFLCQRCPQPSSLVLHHCLLFQHQHLR